MDRCMLKSRNNIHLPGQLSDIDTEYHITEFWSRMFWLPAIDTGGNTP